MELWLSGLKRRPAKTLYESTEGSNPSGSANYEGENMELLLIFLILLIILGVGVTIKLAFWLLVILLILGLLGGVTITRR